MMLAEEQGYDEQSRKLAEAAKELFRHIDLFSTGLEQVRAYVVQRRYDRALQAYRVYLKAKLRNMQLSDLPRQGLENHACSMEQVVRDADELLHNRISLLNSPLVDIGDPIDWYNSPAGDKAWQSHLIYMYFPNCLVHAYLHTGNKAYRDKWCSIALDFISNHPRGVEGLEYDPTRPMYLHEGDFGCGGEGRLPDYPGGSWIALACALRVKYWLMSLKIWLEFDDFPDSVWISLLIDIASDHAYVLTTNPRHHVPNQFLYGAAALIEIGIVMSEFRTAPACYLIGMQRLENAVRESVLPDGTDLEQAFNYNAVLPRHFHSVLRLYGDRRAPRIGQLLGTVKKRCEFLAFITDPLGQWPDVATTHSSFDSLALLMEWADAYELPTIGRVIQAVNGQAGEPPPFTSLEFPYGGYYVMRSGWSRDALYMLFKASRLGTGHMQEDCNSFTLTAFGRNMLVDSGNYNYSLDEASEKINAYFLSSLSHNTVSVDGKGQRRQDLLRQLRNSPRPSHRPEPLNNRWHSSPHFDLAEGTYDDGYGSEAIPVKHERQIVFVKEAGIWIVTDRLHADGKHAYTLAWQFSPDFSADRIRVDKEQNRICTNDAQGPNFSLHTSSPALHRYELKYGEQEPFAGWYASEYNEMRPSADLLIQWEGSGGQLAVSVLSPYQGIEDNIVKVASRFDEESVSCDLEMTMRNGTTIRYAVGLQPFPIRLGEWRVHGESLLLVEKAANGLGMRGMALGCEHALYGGRRLQTAGNNFEFGRLDCESGELMPFQSVRRTSEPDR